MHASITEGSTGTERSQQAGGKDPHRSSYSTRHNKQTPQSPHRWKPSAPTAVRDDINERQDVLEWKRRWDKVEQERGGKWIDATVTKREQRVSNIVRSLTLCRGKHLVDRSTMHQSRTNTQVEHRVIAMLRENVKHHIHRRKGGNRARTKHSMRLQHRTNEERVGEGGG